MWFFLFGVLIVHTGDSVILGNPVPCPVELNPPMVEVKYGDSLSANCTSLANDTDGMGWESPYGGTPLQNDATSVQFHIAEVKAWEIQSKCFMNYGDDQCKEPLPITVYKLPDSVSLPHPLKMQPIVEGQQYEVKCDIANVAPVNQLTVLWYTNDELRYNDTFTETIRSPVDKSSVFKLTAHRDDDGVQIWCEANLNLRTKPKSIKMSSSTKSQLMIQYQPVFTNPENETVELPSSNKNITLNCTAAGNPKPTYSWKLPHPTQKTMKNQMLNESLLTPSFQLPGTYVCTASNPLGTNIKYFNVVPAKGDRTTFAALIGGFLALGVVIAIGGILLVKPDGTCSLNKGGYISGQPTSSGPV